jgi:hypothetical protein
VLIAAAEKVAAAIYTMITALRGNESDPSEPTTTA